MTNLFAGMGREARILEVSIIIVNGAMPEAVIFFKNLGFKEDVTRRDENPDCSIRVMQKSRSISVILEMPKSDEIIPDWKAAITLMASDLDKLGDSIELWSLELGVHCSMDVGDNLLIVMMPTVFHSNIEFKQ
jgi:hypothetical protein